MSTLNMPALDSTLDDALARVTTAPNGPDRVPGVVASVTRSTGTVYEGAAGVRSLNDTAPMTTDSVFAMFSTTKAVTGTTVLQCVEEGLLDLDAPASDYVPPEIADLPVIDGFDDTGTPRLRTPPRRRSPPGCCCCTRPDSAIRSSTRRIIGSSPRDGIRVSSQQRGLL